MRSANAILLNSNVQSIVSDIATGKDDYGLPVRFGPLVIKDAKVVDNCIVVRYFDVEHFGKFSFIAH